jgi:hypothetical protein
MKPILRAPVRASLFCLLLLPFAVFAAAEPKERVLTLTFQPVLLVVPIFQGSAEVRVSDPWSVALFGGGGSFDYERGGEPVHGSVQNAGAQGRWYPRGRAAHEPHLGLQVLWAHVNADEDEGGNLIDDTFRQDVYGRGYTVAGGPFGGYKYTAPFGLTAEAQLGMQLAFVLQEDGENNYGVSNQSSRWTALPILNFGVGWSF